MSIFDKLLWHCIFLHLSHFRTCRWEGNPKRVIHFGYLATLNIWITTALHACRPTDMSNNWDLNHIQTLKNCRTYRNLSKSIVQISRYKSPKFGLSKQPQCPSPWYNGATIAENQLLKRWTLRGGGLNAIPYTIDITRHQNFDNRIEMTLEFWLSVWWYHLVNQCISIYWTWPFIVDSPIQNGDFSWLCWLTRG